MTQIIHPIQFLHPKLVEKKWGINGIGEIWYVNNDKYCLKELRIAKGKEFSDHFHYIKEETWVIADGALIMEYYNLGTGDLIQRTLKIGDIVHIPPGNPHKLIALEDTYIWEASTHHEDYDSYKLRKGDSQK
jgi:mannose-6-phosphate isomerase-like protein (cupin superfamily)